ncbi:MAG: hypothetical protein ABL893_04595 [Hyphomicrobium sp.]
MTATSVWASFVTLCGKVSHWCIWFGKLIVALGIAYAAARMFSLGFFAIEGFRIPYPRVIAEPTQLIYLAGCVYLVTR